MFREYAVDVKDRLAPPGQQNVLVIVFSSPLRFMRAAKLPPDDPDAAPHKSLRKCHSDFSSYLGATPHAVKVGVYRDVVLDLPERRPGSTTCACDRCFRPDFRSATDSGPCGDGRRGGIDRLDARRSDRPRGGRGKQDVRPREARFEIPVAEPKLWWPRMQGAQTPLYARRELAGRRARARPSPDGLRHSRGQAGPEGSGHGRKAVPLRRQRPADLPARRQLGAGGGRYPRLAAGTCPATARSGRARQHEHAAHLGRRRAAAAVVLRGMRPPRHLHLAGLHVRLLRPSAGDTEFLENCRAEIEGTIRRLRNHPSLLLWVRRQRAVPVVFDDGCPAGQAGDLRADHARSVPAARSDAPVPHQFALRRAHRQLAARRRLARLHHDQLRAGGLRAAVRLGGAARQRAVAHQHAAIPERGGTLAEGIRSRHPQAGPAGLAASLGLSLDGHRHVGPRWRGFRSTATLVRRRS